MSSPIASLFDNLIAQVSAGTEISSMVPVEQRKRLLRGLFDSYYSDHSEPVIFDTNRAWTAQLPALMQLFPDSKLICLVRDLSWIMDSLERQYRANAFEHTRLFNTPAERATVYTRLDALAGSNRLVGYAWHALREACYSDFADRLVIVEYDMITHRPNDVFKLLYEFLGEEAFAHDFAGVAYDAPAFDAQLGLDGLHRVRAKVEPAPRETILPPDLFERFSNMAFWRDLKGSKAFRLISQPNATGPSGQMPEATTNSLPQ